MKKLLCVCGVFVGSSLLQLISSTVFLFVGLDSVTKTAIQVMLLLMAAVALILGDIFLGQLNRADQLDDVAKGLVFQGNRLAGILLTIETCNVLALALAAVLSVPMWVYVALLLAMVLATIIGVLVVLQAVRSAGEALTETATDEPGQSQEG